VIGVEPSGADDAQRSFKAGHIIPCLKPITIADGLRTSLGELPFAEIQRHVDDIITVSDEAIVQAMRRIWEVMKIIVEPSGAVAYAPLAHGNLESKYARIGIILSGGNLDLDNLPWTKKSPA